MKLFWTKRFVDSLESAGHRLDLVFREINELRLALANAGSHPKIKIVQHGVGQETRKFGVTLKQWDIDERSRLLFGFEDETLYLIDFSSGFVHDCLEKFKKLKPQQIRSVLDSSHELPRNIAGQIESLGEIDKPEQSPLRLVHSGGNRIKYPEEKTREWLSFLDKPQTSTANQILHQVTASREFKLILLLGGAGTGKTMILKNVANRLHTFEGKISEFRVPVGVRNFLMSEGEVIPGLNCSLENAWAILLDDPLTVTDAEYAIGEAKDRNLPIVIAIDPIQWHERLSVARFEKIIKQEKPTEYRLTVNYRQGEKVGLPAVETIRQFRKLSSEFRDTFKEAINKAASAKFEILSLQSITFADKAGTYAFYGEDEFTYENILKEFYRIGRFKTERKWPKLLIGTAHKGKMPIGVPKLLELFQDVDESFRPFQRAFSQYKEVRGTEFESVILFIESTRWNDLLNGVEGAKPPQWETLNAPLTFLTRAENRCVVFEIPDNLKMVTPLLSESKAVESEVNRVFSDWMDEITK